MDNERHKIVQTLSKLDEPLNVSELAEKSGLSRGKVLGNIARLCIEGFMDKCGRKYVITTRGRAVIGELNSVSRDKAFNFYLEENNYTGKVALSLKDFYEIVKTIGIKSLEFHTRRGDFESWMRDVLHDEELANEIKVLKRENVVGKTLRERLYESIGRNYRMLNTLTT